jgi:oligopeptide transport system ATP-binding protein
MSENGKVILQVKNLVKHFPITKGILFQTQVGAVHAVDGISFEVKHGETFGLVGESGCGKTTAGRTIVHLEKPTSGEIIFDGKDLVKTSRQDLFSARRRMQIIFQDPYASLNPRMTVKEIIEEPMIIHHAGTSTDRTNRSKELLQMVGLNPSYINRYPHEFSGGQRQRIGIARAIALKPDLVICDEPISALDVSIQAQIVNLLEDLQKELGLTYIFIAHDLSMVRHISKRVAVMYLGKIMEMADTETLFTKAYNPYTIALLSAVPVPDPMVEEKRKRLLLEGDVPSPINPPSGCRFHTRCFMAEEKCKLEEPENIEVEKGHFVACHLWQKNRR